MAGSYDFEEQERIAELKAWWEDNRLFVLGAVVAAIVAFAGYRGWVYWQARQADDAAAMYRPLAEAAKAGDAKRIPEAAQAVIDKHPGSYYASEAALVAAKSAFGAGNLVEAGKRLEWVMANGVEEHRGVARMRLAAVLMEQKKYDDALKVLDAEPRDGWPQAYRHALLLVRSDTHVVWRGHALPSPCEALVMRLRGVPAA